MTTEDGVRNNMAPSTAVSETANQGVSVVIPVFDEVAAIGETIDAVHTVLQSLGRPCEVIVVDDGSADGSYQALQQRSDIVLIRHPLNVGYGAAIKTGIRRARYPLIAITDADGSYPLARLPELIRLADDSDMVVGARTGTNVQYSTLRSIPKWFLRRFAEWMTHHPIPDLNSGMRVFRRDIAERFLNVLPNGFSLTSTITIGMLRTNRVVHFEPIDYYPRTGHSKIRPIADTLNFFQLILRTGAYFAPLRLFLPIAGLFFVLALVSLVRDLLQGNLTDSTTILFVATTQLAMFTVLADMIDKRSNS